MKTIVIGLGNPILGDDGVGWKVAEEVKNQLPSPRLRHPSSRSAHLDLLSKSCAQAQVSRSPTGRGAWGEGVDVEFLSVGGISLMESLIGYDRAIVIDAFQSDQGPGSVIVSKLSAMPDRCAFHITSAHDTSLQNALKLGRMMGANLPDDVTVVGVITQHTYNFIEELTPLVAAVVGKAAKIVIGLLA